MDTMVLIGGVSVRYGSDIERGAFLIGAVAASAVWFYGLVFGGKKAAPLFQKAITWRVLDSFIAAVMILVALNLARFQLMG
jgi:L-lysine exporter family protein LysE/ArgO